EYEWKPPHCIECNVFRHGPLQCPKQIDDVVSNASSQALLLPQIRDEYSVASSMGNIEEEQTVGHTTANKHTSSAWNEEFESDDEVDEVIFPEGNKVADQFDIRLEGR
nr:hypothetical protein [Tanacetum cinerariifolium]